MLIAFNHLVGFHKLASSELLVSIVSNELFNDHVAAANADYQLAIHDLCEDLSGSKVVISVAKSLNGDLALHQINVSSQLLINSVTLISTVKVLTDSIGSLELLSRSDSVLAHPIFKLSNLHVFLVENSLQPVYLRVPHGDLIGELSHNAILVSHLSSLDLEHRLHFLNLSLIILHLSIPRIPLLPVSGSLILHVSQFDLSLSKPLTCLLLHHCQFCHQFLQLLAVNRLCLHVRIEIVEVPGAYLLELATQERLQPVSLRSVSRRQQPQEHVLVFLPQ